jgi:hypothetical protein
MIFDPAVVRIERPPYGGLESLVIALSVSKHPEMRGIPRIFRLLNSEKTSYGLRGGATESRFTRT